MKKQFKNQNANGISKPLSNLQNIFLSVSALGSGICIAAMIISFIAPESTIFDSPMIWVPALVLAIAIASTIDFVIIKKVGKFAITECIAWWSGAFHTTIHRKVNTVIFLSIVAFGLVLSFTTSWDGSNIAAGMAPTFTPQSLQSVTNAERETVKQALKPYREAVKSIENKISESVKVKTSGELKRLSNHGNTWAKNEIAKIQDAVSRKYASELESAKIALAKAEDRENGRADKVIIHTEQATVQANKANTKRVGIIWKLLTAIGVLPLIFGFALLIADCNNTVTMQLPPEHIQKQQAQSNGGGVGPGQRSDSFEGLYTNP